MQVTLCDHRDTKGNACGSRAEVAASLRWVDKNWVVDLCDVHAKELTANAREAEAPPSPQVTKLAKAGPKEPTVDSAVKEWALKQGGDIAASINKRGRQSKGLKAKFFDTPEGKVWQQTYG